MTKHAYNSSLKDKFGIDETMFETLDMSAEQIEKVCDIALAANKPNNSNPTGEGEGEDGEGGESGENAVPTVAIEDSAIVDILGKSASKEEILALIKESVTDSGSKEKAKKYDAIVGGAIDEAVKAGIRANGEKFNEDRWRKALSAFSYEEILDQGDEWEELAKENLNAGVRNSRPTSSADSKSRRPNPARDKV